MRFMIRPFRRFPVQCSVTYNAVPFQGQGTVCEPLMHWMASLRRFAYATKSQKSSTRKQHSFNRLKLCLV